MGSRCRLPSDAGRLIGFMHIHTHRNRRSMILDLVGNAMVALNILHFGWIAVPGGAGHNNVTAKSIVRHFCALALFSHAPTPSIIPYVHMYRGTIRLSLLCY